MLLIELLDSASQPRTSPQAETDPKYQDTDHRQKESVRLALRNRWHPEAVRSAAFENIRRRNTEDPLINLGGSACWEFEDYKEANQGQKEA